MKGTVTKLRRDLDRYIPPLEERRVSGARGLVAFHSFGVPFPNQPAPDVSDMRAASPSDSPWLLYIWEPLLTKAPAPPKAAPHCCYIRTVIFYHAPYIIELRKRYWRDSMGFIQVSRGGFEQWDQVETRLRHDEIVEFRGERFKVGCGRAHWQRRRWWVCHPAMRMNQL